MNPTLNPSITRTRGRAVPRAAFRAVDVLFVVDVEVLSFRDVSNGRNGIARDEGGAR